MDKVKLYYDEIGKTLTVWFSDSAAEHVCEEADDDTILIKDAAGHVIGFEKLNVVLSADADGVQVEVLTDPVPR